MLVTVNVAACNAFAEGPEVEALIAKGIEAGAAAARRFVPIDTGALQASIGTEQEGAVGRYGASEEYALYVELGTSRMGAQPYLRPAIDAMIQAISA